MARWWRVLLEAGVATLMLAHLRGLSLPGRRTDAVLRVGLQVLQLREVEAGIRLWLS